MAEVRISASENEKAAAAGTDAADAAEGLPEHHRDRRSARSGYQPRHIYAHYRDVYDLRDKIETGMIEDFRGMIAAIRPSETVTLKLVLSRLMDYLEENREIVTALIKVNAPDGFGKR